MESQEGQGSIFTIIIPCIPALNNFRDTEHQNNLKNELHPELRDKKILIIDDDAMQLTLMKELLANYPIIIRTEINSGAIISILENEPFDLILSDIQMPVIDGFELVKLIRNHSKAEIKSLPVIALSGKRDLTAKDFIDGGFTTHHTKPIQLEQLLDLISQIVCGKKLEMRTNSAEKSNENGPLFNLRSLSQFTNNDPESLRTIINTFVDSAVENCSALKEAVESKDEQKIAETAHKMIPMLKQMEVHSIANQLMPLEDKTMDMNWEQIKDYITNIIEQIENLCILLKKEVA